MIYPAPARVTRPRAAAAPAYDRMSGMYDLLAGPFEWPFAQRGLALLDIQPGERVLELGPGTGRALVELARATGPTGKVTGIDLSPGMHAVASRRLGDLRDRVDLQVGDAIAIPLPDRSLDAAFACFILELFDNPDLPVVLAGLHRVLRSGGRLGVVAMDQRGPPSLATRLYLQAHAWLPSFVDCRPIPVTGLLEEAGFTVTAEEQRSSWGLPITAVVATRP